MYNGEQDIQLRIATADDSVSISEVLRESFADYEPLYTREGFAATTPTSDEIKERFENEGRTWVAIHDEKIVGTVSVVPKGEALYIRSMAVSPKARGKRIGELLLNEIENFAIEHDCEVLILSTTPFLLRAIRLYEKFGFERTDEGPFDLFQTPLFTMMKKINL